MRSILDYVPGVPIRPITCKAKEVMNVGWVDGIKRFTNMQGIGRLTFCYTYFGVAASLAAHGPDAGITLTIAGKSRAFR